jgi:hypothetical protein
MSEFKFACPVCGQHITADSSTSGGQLECPTCFQKIIIPQAPASGESKFILSASQVSKPRPAQTTPGAFQPLQRSSARQSILAGVALLLLVGAAGAAAYVFRGKIFNSSATQSEQAKQGAKRKGPSVPRKVYPIPNNINWTMDLTSVLLPESNAAGQIHGSGFFCEKATLTGGDLSLRQGRNWPPDLGVTIRFFAQQGEELSGRSVEITSERSPPLPKITLRWKDDQDKAVTRNIPAGYALRAVFGDAIDGHIHGRLYLCLPDETKSFIAGTFDAEIRKPPPPKPAKDQAPKTKP